MCWCAGGRGRQSNNAWVPETGDLVREVKRVQAPRLAELTALQGQGQGKGGVAFWLSYSHIPCPVADWLLPLAKSYHITRSDTPKLLCDQAYPVAYIGSLDGRITEHR